MLMNGFLTEDNGNRSTIRLMSILSLFAAIGFGVLILLFDSDGAHGLYLVTLFLCGAFCPKLIQKHLEQRLDSGKKS